MTNHAGALAIEFSLSPKSQEKPLKISSRKGTGQVYTLKRSSSLQALSVRLVEFIYVLAVTMRIKAVLYR